MATYTLTSKTRWGGRDHMSVAKPDGMPCFEVKGKRFTFPGQKYSVFNPAGKIIGAIKQANTFARMKYTVNFEGRVIGEVCLGRAPGVALLRYVVIENMPKLRMESPWGSKYQNQLLLLDGLQVFAKIDTKGKTWAITLLRECNDLYLLAVIATFYPEYEASGY
jgi:hypothetical protein